LRQDGPDWRLGVGSVMGGSNGQMGPFTGTLLFPPPAAPYGSLVLSTQSMEDGGTWEASVIRLKLAVPAVPTTTLALEPFGLGDARFGDPPETVIAALTGLLGEPISDETQTGTMPDGIGGENTTLRDLRWQGLLVSFTDWSPAGTGPMHFARWIASEPVGPNATAFATPEGVRVGSTVADLTAAYGPDVVTADDDPCRGGPYFDVGPITNPAYYGRLAPDLNGGDDAAAFVVLLAAGARSSC
jgi:hypothetical protein